MPPINSQSSGLLSLISVAVAPVVLITATAILLSGFTAKYTGIASQLRALSAEYRDEHTPDARRRNVKRQLTLFHDRIRAMWAASFMLSLALLCFLTTVLAVISVQRQAYFAVIGAASLVIGLLMIFAAILLELYETYLARLTIGAELADILAPAANKLAAKERKP